MKYIYLFLVILLLPTGGVCEEYDGKVEYLSGKEYLVSVVEEINNAKDSIYLSMYLISYNPKSKESDTGKLLDAIINANKRGVEVVIILDRSTSYSHGGFAGNEGKNIWAYQKLKNAGINVFYDNPNILMHSKTVVIDKNIVINGSANWSKSAFQQNVEINLLVKSKELAAEIIEDILKLKQNSDKILPFNKKNTIRISNKFMCDEKFAGFLMTEKAKRGFSIYLFLLNEFNIKKKPTFILDYEKLARNLGIYTTKKYKHRKAINQTMYSLEKKYKLILFNPTPSKDATVTLLLFDDVNKQYKSPEKDFFLLPLKFFEYKWLNKLSHKAKFCYLINLLELQRSDVAPLWSKSMDDMAAKYHVEKRVLGFGMKELRINNLIDIIYNSALENDFKYRAPNEYIVLPLYDPQKLEEKWIKMKTKYEKSVFSKARKYAKIVYKQNDPQVVKDIIIMINTVGEKPVKKAFHIVKRKAINNPRRHYGYVKGIVKKLNEGKLK